MKNTLILLTLFLSFSILNAGNSYPRISEEYKTYWNDNDNIDSPAFWQSKDGKTNYLIATSKSNHNLFLYNAETGKFIKTIGQKGIGPVEFARPNGILVIEDLLLVCERDNHRVQVLSLPDFKHIGFVGEAILRRPYGMTIFKKDSGYELYVTDQYDGGDDSYLPLDELDERVKHFRFTLSVGKIDSKHIKSFGDTKGPGLLFIVESIWADPVNNTLLIAEEDKNQNLCKVYDLDGNFKNIVIGDDIYEYQAEGIALFDCGNGEGYWFCTDQDFYLTRNNTIHIFERKTFEYVGSFITGQTDNTDGIWLTQTPFGKFTKGALFAVDNDGGVGAFDLAKIIEIMKLNCK